MKTLLDREDLVFNPPELGCVLYLPGLPGGASKIYDRSPYGNHGTIIGATWKRLESGLWYLHFDGADDKVECPDLTGILPTKFVTVETWVNFDVALASQTDWVGLTYQESDVILLIVRNSLNQLKFWVKTTAGVYTSIDGSLVSAGIWHHIVGTYDGANVNIYQNGILRDAQAQTGAIASYAASNFHIAYYGSAYLDGKLALFRVYNRPLKALEIQNHFNREKHLFGVW